MRYNLFTKNLPQSKKHLITSGAAMLLIVSSQPMADIYSWKDAQGQTHFGDRPPPESQARVLELRINTYSAPEVKPFDSRSLAADQRSVVMYSTAWCGVCKAAKRYFRGKNIPFKEYDVETSEKGKRDFKRLEGQGVPIILVGNQRMHGFSASRFESIYQPK